MIDESLFCLKWDTIMDFVHHYQGKLFEFNKFPRQLKNKMKCSKAEAKKKNRRKKNKESTKFFSFDNRYVHDVQWIKMFIIIDWFLKCYKGSGVCEFNVNDKCLNGKKPTNGTEEMKKKKQNKTNWFALC